MRWQAILRQNFTQWEALADFLELKDKQRSQILHVKHFPLNLPKRLADKMAKGTLEDPLLKQFLPTLEEKRDRLGFVPDAVGDKQAQRSCKLLHKYHGRALIVCTSACAMHCRYCFRQHYDYDTESPGNFSQELEIIRSDESLREVLLSGGDPLSLSNRVLGKLMRDLAAIPHVQRIRFHTRFPIGIPERIDEGLLELFQDLPQALWFVIHSNHPRELDDEVLARLSRLKRLGVTLLNQSVLLKGINDDLATLRALCERLVDHGILPYYLHQLDRAQGTAHFEVAEAKGCELIQQLSAQLPGYAVPRYVKEIAGEPGKVLL